MSVKANRLSTSTRPPEMIFVPKEPLTELEDGFLRLWFAANRAAAQIEKGSDPQPLALVLQLEVKCALETFFAWRVAKWWQDGEIGRA